MTAPKKEPSVTIPIFAFSIIVAVSGGFIGSYMSVSIKSAVLEEKMHYLETKINGMEEEIDEVKSDVKILYREKTNGQQKEQSNLPDVQHGIKTSFVWEPERKTYYNKKA